MKRVVMQSLAASSPLVLGVPKFFVMQRVCYARVFTAGCTQVNFDTRNALGIRKLTQFVRYAGGFLISRFA